MHAQRTGHNLCFGNLVTAILCATLLRWAIALHSYSGERKPPMFGDYEAQRHWMEVMPKNYGSIYFIVYCCPFDMRDIDSLERAIEASMYPIEEITWEILIGPKEKIRAPLVTINLPIEDWYRNGTDNDLLYWGLDYPPLTAYHSLLVGKVASYYNQSYVQLHESRGYESPSHKTFMRTTVLLADVFTFFIPVVYYFYVLSKKQPSYTPVRNDFVFLAFLYPGLILIDHGHFQYNCVSLGLTVASLAFIFNDQVLLSAFFYCAALNYKQMSLYHSLPFFVYMLRICYNQRSITQGISLLLKIGAVVVLAFALIWSPFLLNLDSISNVCNRLFPVGRGIFEDKVGNVWCAVNVVYKIKILWTTEFTVRVAAIATLLASFPSLFILALYPSHKHFLRSLISVSLAFFLFSYQVHEKSILLVALPVLLYAPYDIFACSWFLVISTISLQHLIVKDNLHVGYIALSLIFVTYLLSNENLVKREEVSWFWCMALGLSISIGVFIFVGLTALPAPSSYPDLWPLLNALYSCFHFVLFYIYFTFCKFDGNSPRFSKMIGSFQKVK